MRLHGAPLPSLKEVVGEGISEVARCAWALWGETVPRPYPNRTQTVPRKWKSGPLLRSHQPAFLVAQRAQDLFSWSLHARLAFKDAGI